MDGASVQELIFMFIGGLGLLLFGIKSMGEGLQKTAGDKMRDVLDKFTTNPIMGVLAGIVVTGIIQSSTGTTVLTIGLVNAGFMTLRQAIGVIMGANIGTTTTAFIIGFDVVGYALPIIAVGTFFIFFFKNKKVTYLGQTIFGLGALFYGIHLMGEGVRPLRSLEAFQELTVNMSEIPVLGVAIGTIFTAIVQSSTATIGVLQSLYAEGAINLQASLPVLFGDNIGTTITAIIAAIGTTVAAKRAAATHLIFNLIGSLIFLLILPLFAQLMFWLEGVLTLEPRMTIAFAHGIFNVSNTLIQLPFIGVLAWIVTKLVPGKDAFIDTKPKHLDPIFIQQSPAVALSQAKEETLRMGEIAVKGLEETQQFLNTNAGKHSEIAYSLESAINNLDRKITNYLVELSSKITEDETAKHSANVDIVRDVERIGDHFENILELIEYRISNKVKLTPQAYDDLNNMFNLTIETVKQSLEAYKKMDIDLARSVMEKEEQIDSMERQYRKSHIIRLNEGLCTGLAGIVFVDIISNLERIGDHAVNIAQEVVEKQSH